MVRHLVAGISVGMSVVLLFLIAGPYLLALVVFLCAIVCLIGELERASRRPLTPVDEECSRIDMDVDARARNARRHLRAVDRQEARPPRLVLVRDRDRGVVHILPPRGGDDAA